MIALIYLFVEGYDDKRFFERVFSQHLNAKYECFQVWEYACKKKDRVASFVRTIRSLGQDVILCADGDGRSRDKVFDYHVAYSGLAPHEICVVVYEIESWYLAGLNAKDYPGRVMAPVPGSTNGITKERFANYFDDSALDAKLKILEVYDLGLAISRNSSLAYFYNSFCV